MLFIIKVLLQSTLRKLYSELGDSLTPLIIHIFYISVGMKEIENNLLIIYLLYCNVSTNRESRVKFMSQIQLVLSKYSLFTNYW